MRSSSINTISGDIPLKLHQKIIYRTLNGLSNLLPPKKSPIIKVENFRLDKPQFEKFSKNLHPLSSPSRMLSDLFWMSLPWQTIEKDLGGIRVMDAGCGEGGVFQRVQKFSGDRIQKYMGFDIEPRANWPKLENENVKFVPCKARLFLRHVPPNSNFFMSQSALEHFPYDLWFFEQVREWVETCQHPVLQVHLLPSAACLKLYGTHGYRQYSERRIQKLVNQLEGTYRGVKLYALGGKKSNQVHRNYITKKDIRRNHQEEYFQKSLTAIAEDMKSKDTSQPSFYALIIRHGLSTLLQIDIALGLCLDLANAI